MDTPEQPTIWPPAPTIAPPEASHKRLLSLPLAYGLRMAALHTACFWAFWSVSNLVRHQHLSWEMYAEYGVGMAWGLAMGAIRASNKFKPRLEE